MTPSSACTGRTGRTGSSNPTSTCGPGARGEWSSAYSMTAFFGGQPGFSTEVELTFAPEGTGTRLILTQRGFPDAATRDDFAGGWSGVWDGLSPVNMTRAQLGR